MTHIIHLDRVDRYNELYGLETLHPLVSVVDLTKATQTINHIQVNYGLYALFLKGNKSCDIRYGRQSYDYQEGTIVCFAPGQSVTVENVQDEVKPSVWGVLFHPDLIRGTSLGKNIKNYIFFFYKQEEALHLSLREKTKVIACMCNMREELHHAIDCHSKTVITRYIELLLDYCTRFYERQFITRCEAGKSILHQTDALLDEYIRSGKLKSGILPSAIFCAEQLSLSPHYFDDLLKFESGKNIYEYFQQKRLELSRKMLLDQNHTVSQVAEELGYANVQNFSRLFKKITGISPQEYRLAQN